MLHQPFNLCTGSVKTVNKLFVNWIEYRGKGIFENKTFAKCLLTFYILNIYFWNGAIIKNKSVK